MFNLPKDDPKYQWTNHVKDKMIYYRISESLVKRIVRFPERKEVGIAPNTVACMQSRKKSGLGLNKAKTEEIWVMYQDVGGKNGRLKNQKLANTIIPPPRKRIISTWRYPGVSPINKPPPIPDEILQELENLID